VDVECKTALAAASQVVIDVGGFLGIGAKPVVVPIGNLEFMRNTLLALASVSGLGATAALAQTAPNYVNITGADALASNIVGLDVYNAGNENVGEISDVALDGSKNVKGVILSVGGFLGMGSKYVVVDPSAVRVRYDAGAKAWKVTMNVTKDQLKAAPEYKYEGKFRD
jgi:sporulation protein YlmC with PRC-barrel domain